MKKLFVLACALAVLLNLPSASFGQAVLGFKGIGGKLGLVDPENLSATIGFGAFADLGTLVPQLKLEGNLDLWSKSKEAGGAESSVRDLTFGGTVKYIFPTANPKLSPYAGGGLGLHLVRVKVKIPFLGESSETDTKIGLRFVGGVFVNLAPQIDGMGEFRYWLVEDANALAILAGIVYKLK